MQNSKGQTMVEYSLLIGIVIAVILAMTPMVKRSAQGMVKIIADEVGYQSNAEQRGDEGLINAEIKTSLDRQQQKQESYVGSVHSSLTSYGETTTVDSKTHSNLGVSEE